MPASPEHPLDLGAAQDELEGKSPQQILAWAADRFGEQLTLACSLGAEDVALVDMLAEHAPRASVFTLDTGRLHEETYRCHDALRERYPQLRFRVLFPDRARLESFLLEHGSYSFRDSVDDRRACCNLRKVEPLKRALHEQRAWITGLRRDQNVTRFETPLITRDLLNGGLFKLNPLASWSSEQVWEYIRTREIPYNALHNKGFPSIGCEPCTRAVQPGEDERAGRWWWENPDSKECGLHAAKH